MLYIVKATTNCVYGRAIEVSRCYNVRVYFCRIEFGIRTGVAKFNWFFTNYLSAERPIILIIFIKMNFSLVLSRHPVPEMNATINFQSHEQFLPIDTQPLS